MKFTGLDSALGDLRAAVAELEQQAITETKAAARTVQSELFANTPVHTGETVRNFAWDVGHAPGGGTKAAVGSGDPGPTNKMPLGSEPRRAANEAAATADMEAALGGMRKLADLHGTNLVSNSKWDLIDSGAAPSPDRARNPGGVEAPAMQSARAKLGNWK